MLTGGWRSTRSMNDAVNDKSVDLIGLARPLCIEPDFPIRILSWNQYNQNDEKAIPYTVQVTNTLIPAATRVSLNGALQSSWHTAQIQRLAQNLPADINISVIPLLTTEFVTAMYWDARKHPTQGTIVYLLYLTTLIGLAALGWRYFFAALGFYN